KPIDQAQFVALLQETIAQVQEAQQRKQRAGLNVRDAQKKVLLDLVKYGFQEISMEERLKRLNIWTLFGDYCVGVMVLKDVHLLAPMSDTVSFTRMNHRIESMIDNCSSRMLQQDYVWAECATGEYLFVALGERTALKTLLNEIQETVKRELCVPAMVGVSDHCTGCHNMFYGYQEARSLALHTHSSTRRQAAPDLDLPGMLAEFENNFEELFRNNAVGELNRTLSFVYDFLFSSYRTDQRAVEAFRQMYESVCDYLATAFPHLQPAFEFPPVPCDSIARMEPFLKKLQSEIKRLESKQNEQRINEICEAVRTLVQRDCASVTLQSAAQDVNISYTYLSIIFKEQTGENFKDYMTRVRMENAARLLGTDKKVYEIAQEVGYSDIKYFSRLFKGFSGSTPNEYREKNYEK
ncbi:MAG: helix-turn-helix domain-containing protein, partial [Gemmiger sp.]|nr:helix-turn-helix domain-containing protein [Gemmiger sp.]